MFFSHEHIEILTVSEECLFFKQRDGPWFPAIRLLHKCASWVFAIVWMKYFIHSAFVDEIPLKADEDNISKFFLLLILVWSDT